MYRGRFAPSPTGDLHFGSLVAATGSYLDARSQGGKWLVRMEDLDPPRVVPGSADSILRALDRFGFRWDGPVMCQSTRPGAYQAALDRLRSAGAVFPCTCSRKEAGDRYPGTCRGRTQPAGRHSWRVRVHDEPIAFDDRLQGPQSLRLETHCGDFVLLRSDGVFAYQLAVVVDDHAQGITDIVRGADLLESTFRQIHVQRLLGLPQPRYLHLPVAVNAAGEKLSKQTLARPVDADHPESGLQTALEFLGQGPPAGLCLNELWDWALTHWDPARLPDVLSIPIHE